MWTLITFSESLSSSAGATVKRQLRSLLAGSTTVPEFLRQVGALSAALC